MAKTDNKQPTPEEVKAQEEAKIDALAPSDAIAHALDHASDKPTEGTTPPPSGHIVPGMPGVGILPRARVAEQEALDDGETEAEDDGRVVSLERIGVIVTRINGEAIASEVFAHEIPILNAINRRENVRALPPDPKLGRATVDLANNADEEYRRLQNVYNNKRNPNVVERVYPDAEMLAEASGLALLDAGAGQEVHALVKAAPPKSKAKPAKGKAKVR